MEDNNYGIFESVQFLNESKDDIIITVNDVIGNNVDEAEAIIRIKKTLLFLERNKGLSKEGLNVIKNGVSSTTIITKGMVKGGGNRKFLIKLANTIIDTPSSNIEVMLDKQLNEDKMRAKENLKKASMIVGLATGYPSAIIY